MSATDLKKAKPKERSDANGKNDDVRFQKACL